MSCIIDEAIKEYKRLGGKEDSPLIQKFNDLKVLVQKRTPVTVISYKKDATEEEQKYSKLSNFNAGPVVVDGKKFNTIEHAYQYKKAEFAIQNVVGDERSKKYNQSIMQKLEKPSKEKVDGKYPEWAGSGARALGRLVDLGMLQDKWTSQSEKILTDVMETYYTTNAEGAALLNSTGYRPIVHPVNDKYKEVFPKILEGIREKTRDAKIKEKERPTFDKLPNPKPEVKTMKGKVQVREGYYNRAEIEKANDSSTVYIFGDNTDDRINTKYVPKSTQAVIRGLPNTLGIDTKKNRGTDENAYFSDNDLARYEKYLNKVFERIDRFIKEGKTIVLPKDGIGTGKALLQVKAPALYNLLAEKLNKLAGYTYMDVKSKDSDTLNRDFTKMSNTEKMKWYLDVMSDTTQSTGGGYLENVVQDQNGHRVADKDEDIKQGEFVKGTQVELMKDRLEPVNKVTLNKYKKVFELKQKFDRRELKTLSAIQKELLSELLEKTENAIKRVTEDPNEEVGVFDTLIALRQSPYSKENLEKTQDDIACGN